MFIWSILKWKNREEKGKNINILRKIYFHEAKNNLQNWGNLNAHLVFYDQQKRWEPTGDLRDAVKTPIISLLFWSYFLEDSGITPSDSSTEWAGTTEQRPALDLSELRVVWIMKDSFGAQLRPKQGPRWDSSKAQPWSCLAKLRRLQGLHNQMMSVLLSLTLTTWPHFSWGSICCSALAQTQHSSQTFPVLAAWTPSRFTYLCAFACAVFSIWNSSSSTPQPIHRAFQTQSQAVFTMKPFLFHFNCKRNAFIVKIFIHTRGA